MVSVFVLGRVGVGDEMRSIVKQKGLIKRTKKIRGTGAKNHIIGNPATGRVVSVVEHKDGWLDMRNQWNVDVYGGKPGSGFIKSIKKWLDIR